MAEEKAVLCLGAIRLLGKSLDVKVPLWEGHLDVCLGEGVLDADRDLASNDRQGVVALSRPAAPDRGEYA